MDVSKMMDYVPLERFVSEGFVIKKKKSIYETLDVVLISKQTCFWVICPEGHIADM